MTPFPLGIDPPGARLTTSSKAIRSPELLMLILAEHQFRGFHRYAKRDVTGDGKPETFCNVHTADVAEAMGVLLPRARANEQILWLTTHGIAEGWEQVPEHAAQACADQGMLVVACWYNRNGGPGHIAPLEPSMGEPGTWCSNVGAINFLRGTVGQAFGTLPVTYFVHP